MKVGIATLLASFAALACGVVTAETWASPQPIQVLLGSGSVGGYQYRSLSHRGAGKSGSRRPCISDELSAGGRSGGASAITICGSLGPGLVLSSSKKRQGNVEVTLLSMLYRPNVRRLKLSFEDRSIEEVSLKLLSGSKARKIGTRRFRYVVLAISGTYCLSHITAFNLKGSIIRSTKEMTC
jgi:hypothetical protein